MHRIARILGPGHIEVIETRFNLAMIEMAGGRLSEELEDLLEALPRFVDVYGWPHAKTEIAFKELDALAEKLGAAGDNANGERAWRALLEFAADARVASTEWHERATTRLDSLRVRQ